MSGQVFNLECRWGARLEDAQACAERLAMMLSALARLHPAFARWNEQGYSRAAANRPFCAMPPRVDEFTRIFEKSYLSPGGPSDGFALSAWNGQDPPHGVSISVFVGSDSKYMIFPNHPRINLPQYEPANADLINIGVLKPALLAFAAAWNPDCADISPWAYFERWLRAEPWNDEQRKANRPDRYIPLIRAGWMTYLCPDYARRINPPRGIEVEPVPGGGALLIATREVFTPGNPLHDAAADTIQDALLPLQNLPCEAMRR